jgi:hypothetical protein
MPCKPSSSASKPLRFIFFTQYCFIYTVQTTKSISALTLPGISLWGQTNVESWEGERAMHGKRSENSQGDLGSGLRSVCHDHRSCPLAKEKMSETDKPTSET